MSNIVNSDAMNEKVFSIELEWIPFFVVKCEREFLPDGVDGQGHKGERERRSGCFCLPDGN
ncbi:MAG: hypothetical protein V8R91_13315 [Butyricimonas faecihominis]